jgi:hypothetical protein
MSSLLEEAYEQGGLTMERIAQISQLTAGALLKRKYFVWNAKLDRFMLSSAGEETRNKFHNTNIDRKDSTRDFGQWVIKYGGGKHGYNNQRSTAA